MKPPPVSSDNVKTLAKSRATPEGEFPWNLPGRMHSVAARVEEE